MSNNLNIVLILCPIGSVYTPPLGLSYLSAALRNEGIETAVKDFNADVYSCLDDPGKASWQAEVEHDKLINGLVPDDMIKDWAQEIINNCPLIAGFSVFDSNLANSLRLADAIKTISPQTKIVFGGPQVPFLGKDVFKNKSGLLVDYLIIGEGEGPLAKLVKNIIAGQKVVEHPAIIKVNDIFAFKKNRRDILLQRKDFITPLDSLCFPDFSDYDLGKYLSPQLPIMFARGCVAKCKFCWETVYWGCSFRCRTPENVLAEVKRNSALYGIKSYIFSDSAVNSNPSALKTFAEQVIKEKLDINWWGQARIHNTMTTDYLKILKNAGCLTLGFGIESVSQKVLNAMNKNYNKEDIQKVIINTYKAGIKININLLVGFPGETEEDIKETEEFLMENSRYLTVVNVNAVGIVPNTQLWLDMGRYGIKMLSSGWSIPKENNTPEERMKRVNRLAVLAKEQLVSTSVLYRQEKDEEKQ